MSELDTMRDTLNQQTAKMGELEAAQASLSSEVAEVGVYVRNLEQLVRDLNTGEVLPPAVAAKLTEANDLIAANAERMTALAVKLGIDTAALDTAGDGNLET